MTKMNQGKIIVFEGLPNSGKTENIKHLKVDFPDFTYYPELATELFKKMVLSVENMQRLKSHEFFGDII